LEAEVNAEVNESLKDGEPATGGEATSVPKLDPGQTTTGN
jgi:hypothetical protein